MEILVAWVSAHIRDILVFVVIPMFVWVFRIEKRMNHFEEQLKQAHLARERNEKTLEKFLTQNREDLSELRADIKKLLSRHDSNSSG